MTLGSHVNFPEAVKNRLGQIYRQRVNVYHFDLSTALTQIICKMANSVHFLCENGLTNH